MAVSDQKKTDSSSNKVRKKRSFWRVFFNWFWKIAVGLLILIMLAMLSLRLPAVQNFVKDQAVTYLQKKLKTKVQLGEIYVGFPSTIELENLYLQGQEVDTLLAAHHLELSLNIPQLLSNKVNIGAISLEGFRANIRKNKAGRFNFDYIVEAFASPEEEEQASEPWEIIVGDVEIKDFAFTYRDAAEKMEVDLALKSLNTSIENIDLETSTYAINDIVTHGLRLKYHQGIAVVKPQPSAEITTNKAEGEEPPLKIALKKIELIDTDIRYEDAMTKLLADVQSEAVKVDINQLDLVENHYAVEDVLVENTRIRVDMGAAQVQEKTLEQPAEATKPLSFLLDNLQLDNVQLVYHNTAEHPLSQGLDYNHLNLSNIHFAMQDFKMEGSSFSGAIKNVSLEEQSGLKLKKSKVDFLYSEQELQLKDLYLQTDKSRLQGEVMLKYASLDQLMNNPGAARVQAKIKNSQLSFTEVLKLKPDLKTTLPFNRYPSALLHLDSEVLGTVDNLQVKQFKFQGLNQTFVKASGQIKNATNPDQLWVNLNIPQFKIKGSTIRNLAPEGSVPEDFALPEQILVTGKVTGGLSNIKTQLQASTSFGDIGLRAEVAMQPKDAERYELHANFSELNLGKFLRDSIMGSTTGSVDISGVGFNPKTLQAKLNGAIESIEYNHYRYQNIRLNAEMQKAKYTADLRSEDENAEAALQGSGIYTEDKIGLDLEGKITKLNLTALGFYDDPLIIAGDIKADFTNLNPDALDGELTLKNFGLSNTKKVFPLQDIVFKATSAASHNSMALSSQLLDFKIEGQYRLSTLADAMVATFKHYYSLQPSEAEPKPIEGAPYFDFTATIKNNALVQMLMPDLKAFETINAKGSFNAEQHQLNFEVTAPSITYDTNVISGTKLSLKTVNGHLLYNFNLDKIEGAQYAIYQLALSGEAADNHLSFNLSSENKEGKELLHLAGTTTTLKDILEIRLNKDGFSLNQTAWEVAPDNYIHWSPRGVVAHDFTLSNAASKIAVNSINDAPQGPLDIEITNFELAELAKVAQRDSLMVRGTLSGKALIDNRQENLDIAADLRVEGLHLLQSDLGNLQLEVNNETPTLLKLKALLSGKENVAELAGTYELNQGGFEMNLNLEKFQMKTLEGLSFGMLEQTSGYLSGAMHLYGTADNPQVRGELKFNQAALSLVQTGSKFKNLNDAIYFTDQGIHFKNFQMEDVEGNHLVLSGDVITKNYSDYAFNLKLHAKDFHLIDSKKAADKTLYGILALDADLSITGDLDLPVVDGEISVTDKTDFTIVVPQTNPELQEREGIVEFIDQDQLVLNKTLIKDSLAIENKIKGINVNVNIGVAKKASFTLVIDKGNGDFIKMQGEGQLTGGMDPSGKITLVGKYEVAQGAYKMSMGLMKRQFDIQKGSAITWTGDPLSAEMDITAIYKTEAPPIDLLEQQLSSDSQINQYKQKMPFYANLKMKGELLKPEITFDITTDEHNNSVSTTVLENVKTKLDLLRTNPSETNKQVFALLLLNRFIGEDPFHSLVGGISGKDMVRRSVSRLLSDQLNRLASSLIKGVNIDFDLQSMDDYSSGTENERTNLNVNLSKQLFNDRLTVTVGSNFGVEGDARKNEKMTNIAGNVAIDYALSRDGRYKIRVYRKDEYQVALQGQVIETGVGFIITLSYDKFREIFQRKKQEQHEHEEKEKMEQHE